MHSHPKLRLKAKGDTYVHRYHLRNYSSCHFPCSNPLLSGELVMTTYTSTTEADRMSILLERAEINLDSIVEQAVSVVIQNHLMELGFHDGSEMIIPVVSFDSRYAA